MTSPPHVVHLITDLDTGGAELMLARLVAAANRSAVRSTVVSLMEPGPVGRQIADNGIPVYTLGLRRGQAGVRSLYRLLRYVRRLEPDILQTWLYHADVAGTIVSWLAPTGSLVWNIRCTELDAGDLSPWLKVLRRFLAAASGAPVAVIANAVSGRAAHESIGYRPRRWEIIPNGFDTERFRPMPDEREALRRGLGLGPRALVVGLLTRNHPMKDLAGMIRAAGHVVRSCPDAHFLLAGRDVVNDAALRALVRELSLERHVTLQPEREDAGDLLAGFDVAVSSSSYGEGLPNVIGEAMACGVPCVVTDVGDSAALVGDTGLVVPPRQPAALGAAVAALLRKTPDERLKLGLAARRRIEREFSLAGAVRRYERFYRELAGMQPVEAVTASCAG